MRESKEVNVTGKKISLERIVIFIVLALLVGLLTGILSHDHLARFDPGHPVWKSWSVH